METFPPFPSLNFHTYLLNLFIDIQKFDVFWSISVSKNVGEGSIPSLKPLPPVFFSYPKQPYRNPVVELAPEPATLGFC